jgi:hypothetical protein
MPSLGDDHVLGLAAGDRQWLAVPAGLQSAFIRGFGAQLSELETLQQLPLVIDQQ